MAQGARLGLYCRWMEALIDVKNAWLRQGGNEVLKDATVSFPTGETCFIVGPSGCGKSTLLKVAAGLLPVDRGDVLVGNRSWSLMDDQESRAFRQYAAFVFQDSALWANMSIQQNLGLALRYHFPRLSDEAVRRRVLAACERVGYREGMDKRPAELSHGEQKLVGFARALMLDPLLLFLDSPLSLVDGRNATRLVELCREFRRQRRSQIIVTNKLEFCLQLADRVVVMDEGRIVRWGPLLEVADDWPESMGRLTAGQLAIVEQRRQEKGAPGA